MSGKYVFHCDYNETKVKEFIATMKQYNRDYTVIYNKQDDGYCVVTFNELIFEDYNDFLDHLEGTSGGYDGTFGYRKQTTI